MDDAPGHYNGGFGAPKDFEGKNFGAVLGQMRGAVTTPLGCAKPAKAAPKPDGTAVDVDVGDIKAHTGGTGPCRGRVAVVSVGQVMRTRGEFFENIAKLCFSTGFVR